MWSRAIYPEHLNTSKIICTPEISLYLNYLHKDGTMSDAEIIFCKLSWPWYVWPMELTGCFKTIISTLAMSWQSTARHSLMACKIHTPAQDRQFCIKSHPFKVYAQMEIPFFLVHFLCNVPVPRYHWRELSQASFLSWQKFWQKQVCCDKTSVATKMTLAAAPADDSLYPASAPWRQVEVMNNFTGVYHAAPHNVLNRSAYMWKLMMFSKVLRTSLCGADDHSE